MGFFLPCFNIPVEGAKRVLPKARIEKIGPHLWKVEENAFLGEEDASTLLGEDVVEPSFLTDDTQDIKLIQIHQNNLLHQAGFQSGDCIIAVNGNTLESAWSTLSLLKELRNTNSTVTVEFARNRKRMIHQYFFEGNSLQSLTLIFIQELTDYLNPFST